MSGHRKKMWRVGIGLAVVLALGAVGLAVALGAGSGDPSGHEKGESGRGAPSAAATEFRSLPFKARPAKLQKRGTMKRIKPKPKGKYSRNDRGAIWDRGCMLQPPETKAKPCVFGRKKARTNVALFGDSHAMHLFGAVDRLAKRRGWRLVAQTKAGCAPATVPVYNRKVGGIYRQCLKWHQGALKRIEAARPKIVIVGVAVVHKPMRDGKIINGEKARSKALSAGYREMLGRLVATGAQVIAVRDLPKAPHDMTDCVAANLTDLERCAFTKPRNYGKTWESRTARSTKGVREVDLSPAICAGRRCFGVIRNELVYRDNDHMTLTFSRSVAPWLARGIDRR